MIFTVLYIGFYGFGCIISCFALLVFIYVEGPNYDAIRGVIWIFGGGFYLLGQWLLLLTFVIRLDVTFKDLPFIRFHPFTVKVLYFAVTSLFVLIILIFITIGMELRISTISLAIVWASINFIASIVMLVLFLHKVFEVMRFKASFALQNDDNMDENNDEIDAENIIKPMTVEVKDVKSATRYALLVSIAIFSTFISLIIMVIITMIHEHDEFDNDKELGALEYLFVGIDSLVNAFCLYLLFDFNEDQYYRTCDFGHSIIERCCVNCVIGKIAGIDDAVDDNNGQQEKEPIDYEDLILR